jgi:cysteine desulfurase
MTRSTIYLDHHGSAPLSEAARRAMVAAMQRPLANPSSIHRAGRETRALIERARASLARACGAMERELVFTSGGTEALHLATHSLAATRAVRSIVMDPGAHPALRAACEDAAVRVGARVQRIEPDRWGQPQPDALAAALAAAEPPTLVALTWVQHEIGSIAPIRALVEVAREHRSLVVLDAVQALGKINVDLGATGAHAAALSAHKIGGPTGIGAAWIRHDQSAAPVLRGGAQERGLRAGTENVLGIVGFGAAAEAIADRLSAMPELAMRRDGFERRATEVEGVRATAPGVARVATVSHLIVRDVSGDELVAAMDLEGLCVSSGPACSSGRSGLSETLASMFPWMRDELLGALRVSLGPETTETMLDLAVTALERVVRRMRAAR